MSLKVDIIILSFGKTEKLRTVTQNCIDSLLASEDREKIEFTTLVIESNKDLAPYQYPGSTTIYPEVSFGYNKYMNIGISLTNNPYICLCNNDLIFHKNWAAEILKVVTDNPEIVSANPYCDSFDYDIRIKNGTNVIRRDANLNIDGILTGWCIFIKRNVFEKIGLLDERFKFWYADNDYDRTLRKHHLIHALVKSSVVTHLVSQSHALLLGKQHELTTGQRSVFEEKWQNKSIIKTAVRLLKSKLTNALGRRENNLN